MRCGGSTGVCACAVNAGSGITVTGDGTAGNPYVVGQASGLAGLTTADTPTVDLGVTGAGTGGDPFVVTGAARTDGIMDLVGSRVATPLEYDIGTHTLGVDLSGAGAGAVDPADLVSADDGNAVVQGGDGKLYAASPGFFTTPAFALGTVSSDVALVELGGTAFPARPGPGYTPVAGHTNVICLFPAAGTHGAGSTDPTFLLMIGRLP